jgi:hypothetical protein
MRWELEDHRTRRSGRDVGRVDELSADGIENLCTTVRDLVDRMISCVEVKEAINDPDGEGCA